MKSPEQRVNDAAAVLRRRVHFARANEATNIARAVLEAADSEADWPTDESIAALLAHMEITGSVIWEDGSARAVLRHAFLADPIIRAAVAYRDWAVPNEPLASAPSALVQAVKDAGL